MVSLSVLPLARQAVEGPRHDQAVLGIGKAGRTLEAGVAEGAGRRMPAVAVAVGLVVIRPGVEERAAIRFFTSRSIAMESCRAFGRAS